jgi:Domain of unknown function (DUF4124)
MAVNLRTSLFPALALAATLLPGPATALEIYKWIDANGVVHYSESHPERPTATPVETFRIASTNSPAYDPDDYYWSILKQAERIGEQWSAIEEERAEDEAESRAAATEARVAELERQLAARESADYVTARPIYGPFAFFPKRHHRLLTRGFPSRRDSHAPPRSDRDLRIPETEPGPGWTPAGPPAVPPEPGFSR